MKPHCHRFLTTLIAMTFACGSALSRAADIIKDNNTTALITGGSFLTNPILNDGTEVAVWDSTVIGTNTTLLGGNLNVSGIRIANPGGAVAISAGNTLTLGASGIDMSAATQNLTLSPNLVIGAAQNWTVNGGRTLTGIAGSTTSVGSGTGNLNMVQSGTGTATIVFNQNGNGTGWAGYSGNVTVNATVKVQSQGNAAAAFGTGTVTLAGGTIAQNNGSWTWGNPIDVTAASVIGTDSSNGLGRLLKLLGDLTSSNSSGLTFTNSTTGGSKTDDVGIILAGANASTYTTTTLSANTRVRVGGTADATIASPGANAGTRGSLGSGDVTLSATTSELAFTRTDAHTVANRITGSGTVVIGGTTTAMAGTSTQVVTLSVASDYTGATSVKSGRLNLTGSLTSAVTVSSGAKISGTGSTGLLTLSSGAGLVLAGGTTTTSITTANGVTFSGSNTATFLSTPVADTVYDVFTYGTGTVTTLSNLTIPYRGTLADDTLNQKYTFTAGEFGATRTWNTTTGTWAVNTDTNFMESDQKFYAADHVVFGDIASDAAVTLSGVILPGSVTVSNAANAYTFSGTAIDGATSLTKSGDGTLALATANTYSGGTTLNAGVVQLGSNTALGSGSLAFNGGKLSSNSATARSIANAIIVGGTVTLGDATNTGVLTLTGNVNFGSSGHKITTVSGVTLSGAAVTLTGSGDMEINGGTFTNNMQTGSSATARTGATTLTSGNLVISTDISMFGSGAIHLNGGAIGSGTTNPRIYTNPVNIGGNVAFGGTGFSTGLLDFQGAVDLQGGTHTLTSNLLTGQGTKISGVISNGGLVVNGASTGVLTLSGTNTYTDATTVTSGYLAIGNSAVSSSSSLSLAANTWLFLGINGTTTVNNLTGVSGAVIRSNFNISGGDGARTLEVNQTVNGEFAGSFAQGTNRAISLTKTGAATLTLSGTTSYTGLTTISNGTLCLNTSHTGTYSVDAAGTLAGTGPVSGAVTAAGTLAPGTGIGTLTVGNTVLTGTYACEIDGTTADQLVAGTLDVIGATLTFSILNAHAPTLPSYTVATYTGTLGGTFLCTTVPTGYELSYATAGQIQLVKLVTAYDQWTEQIVNRDKIGPQDDPDGDGANNLTEFAFGGNPNDAADSGKIYSVTGVPASRGPGKELILTLAVRSGTPEPWTGPTETIDGITYTIEGSSNLIFPNGTVTPVSQYVTGTMSALTDPDHYEYRSFILVGSEGLSTKGFLRAKAEQ